MLFNSCLSLCLCSRVIKHTINVHSLVIGKLSDSTTHVDYVPTLFAFTSEEEKQSLQKQVKRHERVLQMNKKRLQSSETVRIPLVIKSHKQESRACEDIS